MKADNIGPLDTNGKELKKNEREDIFEKNTALEDACGKLMKEKVYLQQQLAGAINAFSESHKRMEARYDELIARQSPATASDQTDQEHR